MDCYFFLLNCGHVIKLVANPRGILKIKCFLIKLTISVAQMGELGNIRIFIYMGYYIIVWALDDSYWSQNRPRLI